MRSLALVAVCVLCSPSLAHAKPKGKADALEKQAKKACAMGDFRKGVEILADLYVQTGDPTYVYNQGRCYEQNHQLGNAIDRFREYLRKSPNLTVSDAQDVDKHIVECKRILEEEEAKTAPPPPPPTPVPPAPVAPLPQPEVIVSSPPPSAPTARQPGAALRTTGVIVGATGLASLVGALVLNLKANNLADKANEKYDPAAESSQSSYKTGALVCYGIGGAALVTGTVLYFVGRSRAKTASAGLAITPVGGPGLAGLTLRGGF